MGTPGWRSLKGIVQSSSKLRVAAQPEYISVRSSWQKQKRRKGLKIQQRREKKEMPEANSRSCPLPPKEKKGALKKCVGYFLRIPRGGGKRKEKRKLPQFRCRLGVETSSSRPLSLSLQRSHFFPPPPSPKIYLLLFYVMRRANQSHAAKNVL